MLVELTIFMFNVHKMRIHILHILHIHTSVCCLRRQYTPHHYLVMVASRMSHIEL